MIEIILQSWQDQLFTEWSIFQDLFLFYLEVIIFFGIIGLLSRSAAVGTMAMFLAFSYLATETGNTVLLTTFFAVAVTIFIFESFQLVTYAFGSES